MGYKLLKIFIITLVVQLINDWAFGLDHSIWYSVICSTLIIMAYCLYKIIERYKPE